MFCNLGGPMSLRHSVCVSLFPYKCDSSTRWWLRNDLTKTSNNKNKYPRVCKLGVSLISEWVHVQHCVVTLKRALCTLKRALCTLKMSCVARVCMGRRTYVCDSSTRWWLRRDLTKASMNEHPRACNRALLTQKSPMYTQKSPMNEHPRACKLGLFLISECVVSHVYARVVSHMCATHWWLRRDPTKASFN